MGLGFEMTSGLSPKTLGDASLFQGLGIIKDAEDTVETLSEAKAEPAGSLEVAYKRLCRVVFFFDGLDMEINCLLLDYGQYDGIWERRQFMSFRKTTLRLLAVSMSQSNVGFCIQLLLSLVRDTG